MYKQKKNKPAQLKTIYQFLYIPYAHSIVRAANSCAYLVPLSDINLLANDDMKLKCFLSRMINVYISLFNFDNSTCDIMSKLIFKKKKFEDTINQKCV